MCMTDGDAAGKRSAIVLDLFDRYYERVHAFARRSVDANVAEDVTQEAFTRLLQHPRLEEMEISISYLLRVVQNLLRRRYTRTAKLRTILEREFAPRERRRRERMAMMDDPPEPGLLLREVRLEEALGRLSSDERDTIRLVVCEGLSYAEAARSLGVSVTTVNNWRHRGLHKLRRFIRDGRVEPVSPLEHRPGRTG